MMLITRSGLLSREDKGWRTLQGLFDQLSEPNWLKPGATGDWTPKDVLAHIACWHAYATDRMEQARGGGKFVPREVPVDEMNVDFYEKCKDLSLHDVRVMSGASRHRFREEIAQTDEPLLEVLSKLIEGNAHGHYEEHVPLLEKFLEGR